jgi:hypothetical protein
MARAYGSSAHLLMKRETAYGQAATGNYIRMPFNRCTLGSEQGPAPVERGTCAHEQCATPHALIDRHRRGRLPDGVGSPPDLGVPRLV